MRILHLEDHPHDVELVRELLQEKWPDCVITVVETRAQYLAELAAGRHELILSDFKLPGFGGLEALELACGRAPEIPFVFLSATIGEDRAIEAVQAGASDYVLKDRMNRLVPVIQRARSESEERRNRRRAEAALVESNERFQLVARATNDAIWDWNLLNDDCWWNEGYETLFGRPRAEVAPDISSWIAYIHPDDVTRVQASIHRALDQGQETWQDEYRFLRADGAYAEVLDRGFILRDAAGQPRRMLGSIQDITARKESETRIRDQARVINQAPMAIVITDLADCITYWNEGARRIIGRTQSEVLGSTPEQVFGPSAAGQLAAARQAVAAAGAWHGEIKISTETGQLLVLDTRMSLICDEAGRTKGRLSIATDITANKKLQEQFFRAQRLEGIGMLAAGIAHDLNNVLTPILMAGPMLRVHAADPLDQRLLDTLEHSAERGAALVQQILAFAHGTMGEPRLMQVRHLARDIIEIIEETFPKSIKLEQSFMAETWPILANPTHIHQVLLNLCVNARDAMPGGGILHLRARNRRLDPVQAQAIPGARPGAFVAIEVEDSGSGIPPEVLKHIWEPFFTTKQEGKGTGLGLATVRGIVENHHGFVELQTETGRGTIFRIHLPAAEDTDPASDSITPRLLPRGEGELILLVDDEATNRDVAHATLGRHGYRVLSAANGTEAVALFIPRAKEIRLVITDLSMPNLDGASLARILRRLKPGLRILAVSGLSHQPDNAAGKPASFADDYLGKPFKADALLLKVHHLLQLDASG